MAQLYVVAIGLVARIGTIRKNAYSCQYVTVRCWMSMRNGSNLNCHGFADPPLYVVLEMQLQRVEVDERIDGMCQKQTAKKKSKRQLFWQRGILCSPWAGWTIGVN